MTAVGQNMVAIETATETVGVAVRTADGLSAEFALHGRRRHVESLTPALEHLLGQVGLVPADLSVVAVDLGPGLFTGLRVGVSAAKGLAQALGLGVVGVTSLEVLTKAAGDHGGRGRVLAAVDARRGEVFSLLSTLGADGEVTESAAPGLSSPDALCDLLRQLDGSPVLAVGDGAQRYADLLDAVPGVTCLRDALAWPPPRTVLALVAERLAQGAAPVDPHLVVPLYMREADAKSNFAQVGGT